MMKTLSQVCAFLLPLLAFTVAQPRRLGNTPSFTSSTRASESPVGFSMKSRVKVPYGTGTGFAYGMGAVEQMALDYVEQYVYTISEQGAVNVIDVEDIANPKVKTSLFIDLAGATGTDIEVCSEKGWVVVGLGAANTVGNGKVQIYTAVQRSSESSPTLVKEMEVGPLPDMILPNSDCTKIAVANEGEGKIIDGLLVDPLGSAMIITDLDAETPTVQSVSFGSLGTDDELIAKGVHLPLPLNAMEYWDTSSDNAENLNFMNARSTYSPAMNLEPEYIGWSADGSKLYVNLQENSALVTVDVPASGTPTASRIDAYGLKDWSNLGIDLVKDGDCKLTKYPGLYSMRNPDSIQVVSVDGETYILTANEGDSKGYGDYEEKVEAEEFLDPIDGSTKFANMTADAQVQADFLAHNSAGANAKRRLTVGSSAVDYSDPSLPVVKKLVMFGGRSVSIFKASDSGLVETWDSGSQLEQEGCVAYPWAHNGVQDEEFSPMNGVLYNASDSDLQETIEEMNDPTEDGCLDQGDGTPGACPLGETIDDKSPKDGPATESIVAGVACGRLVMVTAGEKNSVMYVWDISDISVPDLIFVTHLSPASETKSPGVAYADDTIGEHDAESMAFLDEQHSPSGNAGVLVGGAWSGTMSFWEFECPSSYHDDDDSGAGASNYFVGSIAGVLVFVMSVFVS